MNAEHGIVDATKSGQAGVNAAVGSGQAGVNTALGNAGTMLTGAGTNASNITGGSTDAANTNLADILRSIQGNLSSSTNAYTDAGNKGLTGLENYANSPDSKFHFNLNDFLNSPAYQFDLKGGQEAITNSTAAQGLGQSGAALMELQSYGTGLASKYYGDAFNQAKSSFDTNQNATLSNLLPLIQSGQFGTNLSSTLGTQAAMGIGGQQSSNTYNTGMYNAQNQTNLAQILAQMGLQGSEFNSSTGTQGAEFGANLGMTGAKQAGDYAVGYGHAQAGGTMGTYNNIASAGTSLASLLGGFV
jgi:hypothetical protein